jgi:hypothetical protein
MVRSLYSIVWELIELYRQNYKVTDSVDERLFAAWVQSTRAKLIKQRLDENMRLPDEHWVQDLGYVEMERVDSSVYTGIPSEKYMLRSVKDIPWTIHYKGDPGGFTRIGPADRLSVNFRLVSYERGLTSGNGKFNKDRIYAFLDGQKLCLISGSNIHKQLKYIHVKGIFQNPIDAYEFKNGANTYSWDYEYPISDNLMNDLKSIIVKENFNFIMVPIYDKKPDSVDNITRPTPDETSNDINLNKR